MDEKEQVRVLLRASKILEDGWCQGYWARSGIGDRVMENDPRAVSFCIRGALCKAITDEKLPAMHAISYEHTLMKRLKETLSLQGEPIFGHIDTWNDLPDRTQDEVVELCLATAKRLQGDKSEFFR